MNRKRHQTTVLHFRGTMNAICHLMKRSMFASTYKRATWCGWFFNIISRSNNNNEGCALRKLNRIRIRTDAKALNRIEKLFFSLSLSLRVRTYMCAVFVLGRDECTIFWGERESQYVAAAWSVAAITLEHMCALLRWSCYGMGCVHKSHLRNSIHARYGTVVVYTKHGTRLTISIYKQLCDDDDENPFRRYLGKRAKLVLRLSYSLLYVFQFAECIEKKYLQIHQRYSEW